jgi:multimeric flavodoxin WrbA
MIKVLAFNGSPKTDKGNTTLILTPFLDGMREAGARVELFYTKKLEISPCQGEANCWFKHPGRCFQDDDMNPLLPKFRAADILAFASPVYCDGITGPLKNLIDRLALPLMGTSYCLRDGHSRLSLPEGYHSKKLVFVSSCGLWETDNFDPAVIHMRALSRNMASEFAGALLRPHATLLRGMADMGAPIQDVFDSAREAGRQLVEEGKMSEETLQTVSRELIPREQYMDEVNRFVEQAQGELATP